MFFHCSLQQNNQTKYVLSEEINYPWVLKAPVAYSNEFVCVRFSYDELILSTF